MKYLLPASSRVQGTKETFGKCLKDDRGGWRKAGKETQRKGVLCQRRVRTSMQQEMMKRDEISWSDGDHKSLV